MVKLSVRFFVYADTNSLSIFVEILLEVAVWLKGKLLIPIAASFLKKALKIKGTFLNLELTQPIFP